MKEPSRVEIWKMFDRISPSYDLVNRIMTLGIDRYWRTALAKYLPERPSLHLLDCATGTGDQLLALLKRSQKIQQAIGIDLAEEMLKIGRSKIEKAGYKDRAVLQTANVLELPFSEACFDCVTISFGIRNLTDLQKGLQEMHRVLNPGGRILILESSLPKNKLWRALHLGYLRGFLPRIGALFSKNRDAYVYLNKTIETFPCGAQFCTLLMESGFHKVSAHPFLGGVVTLYCGDKA